MCEGGAAGLEDKALFGSGTAERQVAVYFLCGSGTTELPSIIPWAEAEFQYSECGSGTVELKVSVYS